MPLPLIREGETTTVKITGEIKGVAYESDVVIKLVLPEQWMPLQVKFSEWASDHESLGPAIAQNWLEFIELLAPCVESIDGDTDVAKKLRYAADRYFILKLFNEVYAYNDPDGGTEGNSPSQPDGSSGMTDNSPTAAAATDN